MSFNPQPKNPHVSNPLYIAWIKSLPCCKCQAPSDDAHHGVGYGWGGMAMTADDYLTMPICRGCHSKLHQDPKKWESAIFPLNQPHIIELTLLRAYSDGRISKKVYLKYVNLCLKARLGVSRL